MRWKARYEARLAQFLPQVVRPLDALAQLTELRATFDRLERVLAGEARRSYSTWDEIGTALGISCQAAHRFVNRASGL